MKKSWLAGEERNWSALNVRDLFRMVGFLGWSLTCKSHPDTPTEMDRLSAITQAADHMAVGAPEE